MKAAPTNAQAKKRLYFLAGIEISIGLCAPLWLPLTGTSLGTRGDFLIGLTTAAISGVITYFVWKRNNRAELGSSGT